MDIHNYVVNLLENYNQNCVKIKQLQFDIQHLTYISEEGLIQSMALPVNQGSFLPSGGGQISDKTADAAIH